VIESAARPAHMPLQPGSPRLRPQIRQVFPIPGYVLPHEARESRHLLSLFFQPGGLSFVCLLPGHARSAKCTHGPPVGENARGDWDPRHCQLTTTGRAKLRERVAVEQVLARYSFLQCDGEEKSMGLHRLAEL
jgi:hypothetical protein